MKNRHYFIVIIILFNIVCPYGLKAYTLFDKGKSNYSIVVSDAATPSEKFAAKEMQFYLHKISNIMLPIVRETEGVHGNRIYIGFNREVAFLNPNLKIIANGKQNFKYLNVGGDIIIIGGLNNGTLYGVYSFLEREFSVRWLTKDYTDIPKKESWLFYSLDYFSSPAFEYRYIYSKSAFDVLWSLRNFNNGRPNTIKTEYGVIEANQNSFWSVHTFNRFVSPKKYFTTHPDFFSLINGKREPKQLCLTNEKVLELCVEGIKNVIKKYPQYQIYDLSQNDNVASCQCLKCRLIKLKYGSESGLIIWFVNKVAHIIKKEYPDKMVGTLAYQFSQRPPKRIKPDNNVAIRLSVINTCLIHDYLNCRYNKEAYADIKGWSNITNNLYIWDYISSSRIYYAPIPNFESIKRRLLFYRDCGIKGVMFEGNSSIDNGEFSDLRNYVITKLLWSPDLELDIIVNDFMTRYYKNVATYMKEYYLMTQKRATIEDNHLHFVMDHKNSIYKENYLESAYQLLSLAGERAEDDVIRWRVNAEKMSVAYMLCKVNPILGHKIGAFSFVKDWTELNGITSFAGYGDNVNKETFFNQMSKLIQSN